MKKILILGLIVFLFGLLTVSAQRPSNDHSIGAWVEDVELEKDIFIRDKPSGFGKILGEIPSVMENSEKVIVGITGYSKGWLRIQTAIKKDDTVIFNGDGWIKANRVNAAVYSRNGKAAVIYSSPKLKSKIGTIPNKAMFEVVGYDRFGLKIRYREKTGWLSRNNICGNPFTLCS